MEPAPFKDMSQQFVETLMLIRQNFYRQTAVPIPLSQFGVLCVLVEAGLVEKTADIHDRRRVVITMTTAGQALLDEQNELVRQRFYKQSQKLSQEENRQLANAIQTYNQLISRMFA